MFKKLLPSGARATVPASSSAMSSPSSLCSKQGPTPTNESVLEEEDEGELVSPSPQPPVQIDIDIDQPRPYSNVDNNDNGNDADVDVDNSNVPTFIISPAHPSTTGESSSSSNQKNKNINNHRGHTRNDSIETSSSQSIDVSSLLKDLEAELQQDDRPGIESPLLSSLEACQLDTSLMDGIEGTHTGSDSDKNDCNINININTDTHNWKEERRLVEEEVRLALEACQIDMDGIEGIHTGSDSDKSISSINISTDTHNTNETTANKVKGIEVVPDLSLAPSPPASVDDDSIKPSSSSIRGHDLLAMAQVGNQLFRESLLAGKEEAPIQKETSATSSENLVPDKEERGTNQEKTLVTTTNVAPKKTTLFERTTKSTMVKNLIFLGMGVVLFIGCVSGWIPLDHSKVQLESPADHHSDEIPLITNIKSKVQIEDTADHNIEEVHTTIVFNIKSKVKNEDTADHNGDEAPIVSSIKSKGQIKDTAGQELLVSSIKSKVQIKHTADRNDDKEPIVSKTSDWRAADAKREEDGTSEHSRIPLDRNAVSIFYYWQVIIASVVCGLWFFLRPALASSFSSPKAKPAAKMESTPEAKSNSKLESSPEAKSKAKMEPTTPISSSPRRSQGERSFLTPSPCNNRSMEPTQWMSPCYGENALDVSVYESMKAMELRELLRNRDCNYRGTKQQMIKMLIHLYQTELACLSVQQIRPKLRKRRLSQKGNKADVIRRLVESGPI